MEQFKFKNSVHFVAVTTLILFSQVCNGDSDSLYDEGCREEELGNTVEPQARAPKRGANALIPDSQWFLADSCGHLLLPFPRGSGLQITERQAELVSGRQPRSVLSSAAPHCQASPRGVGSTSERSVGSTAPAAGPSSVVPFTLWGYKQAFESISLEEPGDG